MTLDDIIEQSARQQSTEWRHSITDRLSRESLVLVRSIQHLTSTNAHSPISFTINKIKQTCYPTILTHSVMILVDNDGGNDDNCTNIEQVPPLQSTEWRHSIIDWLSRESSELVRSIQHLTSTNARSPKLLHQQHQARLP